MNSTFYKTVRSVKACCLEGTLGFKFFFPRKMFANSNYILVCYYSQLRTKGALLWSKSANCFTLAKFRGLVLTFLTSAPGSTNVLPLEKA